MFFALDSLGWAGLSGCTGRSGMGRICGGGAREGNVIGIIVTVGLQGIVMATTPAPLRMAAAACGVLMASVSASAIANAALSFRVTIRNVMSREASPTVTFTWLAFTPTF